MQFEWDEANEGHIAERHGIKAAEAEEALSDPDKLPAHARKVPGERRYSMLGATDDGRILYVVFVRHGSRIRVVTARDANFSERRRYRRNT